MPHRPSLSHLRLVGPIVFALLVAAMCAISAAIFPTARTLTSRGDGFFLLVLTLKDEPMKGTEDCCEVLAAQRHHVQRFFARHDDLVFASLFRQQRCLSEMITVTPE